MKKIITLAVFASIAAVATTWAQPIITDTKLGPIGTATFGYPIPGTMVHGTAGANQTWNYGTVVHDPSTYNLKYVDFAGLSATMKSLYPTGNLANEYVLGGSTVATLVFRKEATALIYQGMNTTVFAPPDTQLVFPFNFLETHAGFTYDAYGTLTTPFGTYTNVVRLKETVSGLDKYDYWQFDPYYILLMEYKMDPATGAMTEKAFFNTAIAADINEVAKANRFDIYPSPASDFVNIKVPFNGKTSMAIYDLQGKQILSRDVVLQANMAYKIELGSLVNGVYTLKMVNAGQTYGKNFIVQ